MWGPFYNKPGVIVSWENVWKNKYVQMYKVSREVYLNENLNEIKNWDLIKEHSKRANVIFSDSENQGTKTKHFAFRFNSQNVSDLLKFYITLKDDKGEPTEFEKTKTKYLQ